MTNSDFPGESSIAEQAAAWRIALGAQDPRRVPEFWTWVTRSPEHVREALLMGLLNHELQNLDTEAPVSQVAPAVPLSDHTSPDPSPTSRGSIGRSRWRLAALAIAASLALVAVTLWWFQSGDRVLLKRTYSTDVGEQLSVKLEDGSRIVLDAQSHVQVQLSRHQRLFYLEGQALFNVVHDPRRPFRVRAGATTIEALGTEFNVRAQNATTVSVLNGAVRLYSEEKDKSDRPNPSRSPENTAQLSAGDAASVDANGTITAPRRFDPATVTAWEQRRLVFSRVPLDEIAREFNRYNRKGRIRVEGNAALLRFGGVFEATDPGPLLLLLARNPSITIEHDGADLVIRDKPQAADSH